MTKAKQFTGLEHRSLYAYMVMLELAFSKAGFGYVEAMDRWMPQQRSRYGGYELILTGTTGAAKTKVIVKIVRDTFRERNFSELDGAIKKANADFGILVSPFVQSDRFTNLSPSLHERIDVISGFELVDFFQQYGVGIRSSGEPDFAYLDRLDSMAELHNRKLREFKSEARSPRH